MKIKFVFIICFMLSIACCNSKANKGNALSSEEDQAQATLTQEEIMYDYVNSLDEFAQVMPKFGQDTEAEWAADTVRVMLKKIKEAHLPLPENLARICQTQDYLAYGMVYFNAIIGAYNDPMLSKIALNIIPQSDETFKELSDEGYKDVRGLALYRMNSINNMQLFKALNQINNGKDIHLELYQTNNSQTVLDSISQTDSYSDVEINKIACVLESYAYFKMMCPLIALFAGSQEKYDSQQYILTNAALHIDSQSTPILQAVKDHVKVKAMSDSEFEKWIIKSWQHKVELMKILTKMVKEWEPSE